MPTRLGTALRPYLLIAPSVVFLLLLFVVPLVQTVALAFTTPSGWALATSRGWSATWISANSIRNTFALVICVVPLQLAASLGMSMMLRHVRWGRDLILWIWTIPMGSPISPRGWYGSRSLPTRAT